MIYCIHASSESEENPLLHNDMKPCLRLVEDSEGLRLSLWGVQGVAAGVPRRVLVITQEEDAGTGFKLQEQQKRIATN